MRVSVCDCNQRRWSSRGQWGPVVGTHISTHGEFWFLISLEKKKEKQHWLDSFNLWEAFGCLVMVHDPA